MANAATAAAFWLSLVSVDSLGTMLSLVALTGERVVGATGAKAVVQATRAARRRAMVWQFFILIFCICEKEERLTYICEYSYLVRMVYSLRYTDEDGYGFPFSKVIDGVIEPSSAVHITRSTGQRFQSPRFIALPYPNANHDNGT